VTEAASSRILVIAYGNPLRGDDGAAWRVADGLQSNIDVRCGQQLLPEWAADIADSDLVIFVDASVRAEHVELEHLSPCAARGSASGHILPPEELLRLAETAFGSRSNAYLVHLPARDFGFGEELSPSAAACIDDAVRLIEKLVQRGVYPA
jgi:hydrogenase maturation protease